MKKSQTHLWITLIVILLIASVGFNLYFIIKSHQKTKSIVNLATAYGKEMSGDMIGLTELLDKAKENNWKTAEELLSIVQTMQLAQTKAYFLLNINSLLSKNMQETLAPLASFTEVLNEDLFTFNEAVANLNKGLPIDTKRLEDIRAKVENAKFPLKDKFSFRELRFAIERYLGK
jgi:hypothetical protein